MKNIHRMCGMLLLGAALFVAPTTGWSNQPMPNVLLPDFSALAEKASPAVVSVQIYQKMPSRVGVQQRIPEQLRPFFPWLFGPDQNRGQTKPKQGNRLVPTGAGSGFLISADGYVVTNHHVVQKGEKIEVQVGEDETYTAELIGSDEKVDVALLKIESKKPFPFLKFGDPDEMKIGQWVVAIGNPFRLNHTVTSGIISAKERNIGRGSYDNYIQTDASINPGNSGGPLLNLRGEVIGMNTAIITRTGESAGIGLAVPADMVENIVRQLRENGEVTRGWLGVQIQKITPQMAKGLGLNKPRGALVAMVTRDSPAQDAGLESSDVITHVDGTEIGDYHDLPLMISQKRPGTKVRLQIYRDGKSIARTLTLASFPDEGAQVAAAEQEQSTENILGMVVRNVEAVDLDSYGLESRKGALVVDVVRGSPADYASLRAGDLIQSLKYNGRSFAVDNVEDLEDAADSAQDRGAEVLVVVVVRNGQKVLLALDLAN